MAKYSTPEERESYADRLAQRVIKIVAGETPVGIGASEHFWLNMAGPDRELIRALGLFEKGEVSKETVDKAAVLYLGAVRQEVQRFQREAMSRGKVATV